MYAQPCQFVFVILLSLNCVHAFLRTFTIMHISVISYIMWSFNSACIVCSQPHTIAFLSIMHDIVAYARVCVYVQCVHTHKCEVHISKS